MKYYQKTIKEITNELDSDLNSGLTSSKVKSRYEKYGLNKLKESKKVPFILKFIYQLKDFMILILFIAAILSFVTKDYAEGALVISIILINALVGAIQESRAEDALKAIEKLSTPHTKVIRNGVTLEINSEELTIGDIVVLKAGDYIPADIRLIETVNFKVDESSLTGEAVSVLKNANQIFKTDIALADRTNMCYMSTISTYGRAKGIVTNIGMDTEIGKIADMISSTDNTQTPLQKQISKLGKTLAIVAMLICLVIFIINIGEKYIFTKSSITWQDWKESLMAAVALAVAAIPEGLPAIITICLAIGMQNLAKQKAIMKNLPSVETLGATSIICSDKTGTLTLNKMTVTNIFLNNKIIDINNINLHTKELTNLINIGVLCNDSKVNKDKDGSFQKVGDPTELAFIDLAINLKYDPIKIFKQNPRIFEFPFDSKRKMMTTIHNIDGTYYAFSKGAPDVILSLSKSSKSEITKLEKANTNLTNKALRVLALSIKNLGTSFNPDNVKINDIESDLEIIGLVGMIDPPRPEVKNAIKLAKKAGIETIMITGDHKNTATAIAKSLTILDDNEIAITGPELDKLSDLEFFNLLPKIKVYARVSPENKVRIVNAWKKKGNISAMTGDGVNDAPALKETNIGIAMGITGTEVSKGAADMILIDDNFTTIVNAVSEGRSIYTNIQKTIHFLLSSNVGEIVSIFLGTLIGAIILKNAITPLTAAQILWVNLVTDSFLAISMGLEKREKNIMDKKPRDPNKSFFSGGIGLKIIWQGIFIGVLTFGVYLLGNLMPNIFGIKNISIDQKLYAHQLGSTMAFMLLALIQVVHSFNTRSEENSIFKLSINKFHILAVVLSTLLQILTILFPFSRQLFNLQKLNYKGWLLVIGLSLSLLVIVEIVKLIKRKRKEKEGF